MEQVAQFSNTVAIAVIGILVWFYLRGRFEQVDQRFDKVERELADLRAETNRRFELLMAEILAIRSDLMHVALAVGAPPRPEANQA